MQIQKAGPGKLFDGAGLTFIKKGETGSWIYRYSFLGKRREMGLGSWPAVSLAVAREKRDSWEAVLASERDPIDVRNAARDEERRNRDKDDPTFAEATQIVFDARKAKLRGEGKRGQWINPIENHILPKIGHLRISQLHQSDIKSALAPIWRSKHPTAKKCIGRILIVLDDMELMGYECNPGIVRSARKMLGDHNHTPEPIPATSWQDVPALFARLDSGSAVDQCLRLIILTAVRVNSARAAETSEIAGDVWTVPADRIKATEAAAKDFRVPITGAMREIFDAAAVYGEGLIFPSYTGKPVTDAALEKRLRVLGENGRPHGFRTSFRTWAQDMDACSWEVAETVLGHSIGNTVERSYARSDLLERRRIAMEAWAAHVTGAESTVIKLRG